MVALTSRVLAAAGIGVLLLDPHGTGDSGGDFAEARWETWRGDVTTAADWLQAEAGGPVGLWGLRLGGLLAAEALKATLERFNRLLLWAPVAKGETFLTQFLRIRVAAAMGEEFGENTKTLRAQFAAGESVEVAGYEIAPDLAAALDGAALADCAPPAGLPVTWFDLVAQAGRDLPPASRRLTEAWTEAGVDLRAEAIQGDPFWSLQEIALAPSLIPATLAALAGDGA